MRLLLRSRSVSPHKVNMKWAHNLRADTENVCVLFLKKNIIIASFVECELLTELYVFYVR